MSDEIKRMCKWDKKRLKKDGDDFAKAVAEPRFVCGKCIRVAHSKKKLCDPIELAGKGSK